MDNTLNLKEINDVQTILNKLFPLVESAEEKFKSAKFWGFLDIFGGGFLVDVIKHSKLENASSIMNQINYLLHDLQRELKDIVFPTDYSMNTFTFASFADFVFDGLLADAYMQSKIANSLKQVQALHVQLNNLQSKLNEIRRRLN